MTTPPDLTPERATRLRAALAALDEKGRLEFPYIGPAEWTQDHHERARVRLAETLDDIEMARPVVVRQVPGGLVVEVVGND